MRQPRDNECQLLCQFIQNAKREMDALGFLIASITARERETALIARIRELWARDGIELAVLRQCAGGAHLVCSSAGQLAP